MFLQFRYLIHKKCYSKPLVLLILAILCTCCQIASAQRLRGELIVGINGSQIDGDKNKGYHKAGLNTGFGVILPFNDKWAISFEGLYSSKGSQKGTIRQQDSTIALANVFKFTLNYAEIPLMLHFTDNKTKIQFGAGVSFAKEVSRGYMENGLIYDNPPSDFFIKESGIDWLSNIECVISATRNIKVNIRWQYSLVPFGNNPASLYRAQGMFNNVLSLRLKYVFNPLGGKNIRTSDDIQ